MRPTNPFSVPAFGGLFRTLIPDFVLAFTFFTALTYAVLSKRFDRQRTAAAMSVSLGLALSVGLIWWEGDHGWSIRDLGPVALILATVLLAGMIFQAIRQIGGSTAGIGIALGAGILMAWLLGFDLPAAGQVIATFVLGTLIFGVVSLLVHLRRHASATSVMIGSRGAVGSLNLETAEVREDLEDIGKDRRFGKSIWQRLRKLRKDSDLLGKHPGDAANIMEQIRRMLPAEGWLTERLARLRARAHRVREGHVARIEELRHVMGKLPTEARKRASQELARRYRELKLDTRLERLDGAVAENERRIKDLTRQSQQALAQYDYRRLTELLESAEKLQSHNTKLFGAIDRTEEKLAKIIRQLAQNASKWPQQAASAVRVTVRRAQHDGFQNATGNDVTDASNDAAAAHEDRQAGENVLRQLRTIRKETKLLPENPEAGPVIMAQLRQILPEEGWLTEQMARLRAKAHHIRQGHIDRLDETRAWYHKLSEPARKHAAADLANRYQRLIDIDDRLERLDTAVAKTERMIRELTVAAEKALAGGEHERLRRLVKNAEKLQRHACRLVKAIERTEKKLADVAQRAMRQEFRGYLE